MSKDSPSPQNQKPASLHYGDGEFAVLGAGTYVSCAITGAHIPLTSLKYWSVERQEAYAGPLEYISAIKAG